MIFAVALSAMLQGCVIVPVPTSEHGLLTGRGAITDADSSFLMKGQTTREEVLLRFGEPSVSLNNGRIFVYHWQTVRGYVVGAGYMGGGDIASISKDHLILLEFGDNGRLTRFECSSLELFESLSEHVDQWTPSNCEKLGDISKAVAARKASANSYIKSILLDPKFKPDFEQGMALGDVQSLNVCIQEFKDCRKEKEAGKIGVKTAAFRVKVACIYMTQRPSIIVYDAVSAQWAAAGHRLVEKDAEITIKGRIQKFLVETEVTLTSCDAVGSMDIIIEVFKVGRANPASFRYLSKQIRKKYIMPPGKKDFENVLESCLNDLMQQMASDRELVSYIEKKQK